MNRKVKTKCKYYNVFENEETNKSAIRCSTDVQLKIILLHFPKCPKVFRDKMFIKYFTIFNENWSEVRARLGNCYSGLRNTGNSISESHFKTFLGGHDPDPPRGEQPSALVTSPSGGKMLGSSALRNWHPVLHKTVENPGPTNMKCLVVLTLSLEWNQPLRYTISYSKENMSW